MRNFFDAVWWWTRLCGLLVVAVYLISLIALNAGETPRLWYWYGRGDAPVSIVSLVLVSFLSGGVVFTTGWAMLKALIRYRKTREARRERAESERRRDVQRKAAMLRTKPPPQPIVRRPAVVEQTPVAVDPRDAEPRAVAVVAAPSPAPTRVTEAPVEVAVVGPRDEPRPPAIERESIGADGLNRPVPPSPGG